EIDALQRLHLRALAGAEGLRHPRHAHGGHRGGRGIRGAHELTSTRRYRRSPTPMSTTTPAATRPMRTAPKMGDHCLGGSELALAPYSTIARPIPPRIPMETSATTAPTTALAAARRRAGMRYGTLAGSRRRRRV